MGIEESSFATINGILQYATQIYKYKSGKQAALYLLRSSLFYQQTQRWLKYLDRNPSLAGHKEACLELAAKIYRPFLRSSYGVRERISALVDHIDIMTGLAPISTGHP